MEAGDTRPIGAAALPTNFRVRIRARVAEAEIVYAWQKLRLAIYLHRWLRALWRLLPTPLRLRLRALRRLSPRVGGVNFGSRRKVAPLDPEFGFGRGQPIDRYYI